MNTEVMFSSKAMDWATPQKFFDQLDSEFHFTLDPCADETNHKCARYFTAADDGLKQSWGGQTVFCNPPYGKAINEILQEALALINAFCEDRSFRIYYTRIWNRDDTTIFDVGSHTEFFYLTPKIDLSD